MDDITKEFHRLSEELKNNIKIEKISNRGTLIEYKTEGDNQTCIGWGLYKDNEVAVQRNFMSDGTKIAKHAHGVVEWFLCVAGEVTITILGEDKDTILYEKTLTQGEGCHVDGNQWHRTEAHTDSKLLIVTIPADDTFPEGV